MRGGRGGGREGGRREKESEGERKGGRECDTPSRIASFFFWSPPIVVALNLQHTADHQSCYIHVHVHCTCINVHMYTSTYL